MQYVRWWQALVRLAGQRSRAHRSNFWVLLAACLGPVAAVAQNVKSYSFTQAAGTYTELAAPRVLAASTSTDDGPTDDQVYAAPLPFAFIFNGVTYTSISVSTNGFITFGGAAPQPGTYDPLDAATTYSGAAAALASDLVGQGTPGSLGELSYATLGSSPNRAFVVQWKHFARFVGGKLPEDLNFQIQLSEASNAISFVYGACAPAVQPTPQQVGLRGRNNTDFNSRAVSNSGSWDASAVAASRGGTAALSKAVYPRLGLTYTFAVPAPAAPTALAFSAVTATSMTAVFTDNSLTESSFLVEYGPDATFAGASSLSLPSITKTTTGTTYAAVLTGLLPATTYYVRVRAVGEAQSAALGGVQATTASQGMAVAALSYAQSGATTYRGYAAQPLTSLVLHATGSSNPLSLSSLSFDMGATSLIDISNLQLYQTTSSTFDLATASRLLATSQLPMAGGACTLTLDSPSPLNAGDTYYWLACDVAPTATPGHTLGAVPTAASIGGGSYTAFSRSGLAATRPIAQPLDGTYAVGAGGDYATLTLALADLARRGVATEAGTAGVTLALTNQASAAVYNEANGEAFPLVLRTAAGMDATHRVTIRPAAGVRASISGSVAASAVVLSEGGDFFTLDGASAPGGSTRDLSIANTSLAASAVVWLQSQGPAAGASYVEVRNLNLRGGTTADLTFGVLVGGANLSFESQGADNDYVSIENNTVANCYVGILAAGAATASAGGLDELSIRGNLLGPAVASAADNLGYAGLEVSYAVSPSLRGNTVQNVRTSLDLDATGVYVHHTTGLVLSGNTVAGVAVRNVTSQFSAFGIYLGTGVVAAMVSSNVVRDILTTSTNQIDFPRGVGVCVSTATLGADVELSNNFISGIAGQFGPIGLFLDGQAPAQSGIRLYHNSVNLQGSYASVSGALSTALYVPAGTTGIDSRNNLLVNMLVGSSPLSLGYALYSTAGGTSYIISNYNDYYANGAQNSLALVGSGLCSALDQLRSPATGLGQEAESLNLNPDFASDTDLHIESRALAAGTPLGSVPVDIDGDTRSAVAPTMGADELQPLNVDVQPVALAAPAAGSTCFGSAEPMAVTVRNATAATLDFTLHPLLVTVEVSGAVSRSFTTTLGTNAGNPGGRPLAGGATVTVLLPGTLDLTATGSYRFAVTATAAGDGNTTNDNLEIQTRLNATPAMLPATAAVSICGGSSASLTYAGYGSLRVSPAGGVSIVGATVTFSPSATTSYLITGISLDAAHCQRTVAATVTVNASTTWTGAAGTDWFAAGNWTNCVPTRTTDALLPVGAPAYPSLDAGSTAAEVRSLTLAAGAALSQRGGALNIYGSLSSAAGLGLALAGGTVTLLGAQPQVTGVAAVYELRLSLDNALAVATLGGDLAVTHALTLAQGVLATDRYTLTLPAGATLAETDASYVLGRVQVPGRDLAAGAAERFGGIGLTLTPDINSAVLPGATTVVRTTGVALRGVASSQSILRYFDIQPAVDENLDVRMDLAFWEHERNGIAASNLQLFKSTTGSSGPWVAQAASVSSPTSISKEHISDFSTWTLGSTANPLPVELSQFDATRQGPDALLTWATASELNNRGFEVQASLDGQAFRALGFVAGAGSSATTRRYRYLDQTPGKAGRRYYRLRQLDASGAATYSPVRTVGFEAAVPALGQAAPNPFINRLILSLVLPAPAPVAVTLADALGRPVYRQELGTLAAGTQQPTLAGLEALPPGLYLLRVAVAGQVHTLKVVKE